MLNEKIDIFTLIGHYTTYIGIEISQNTVNICIVSVEFLKTF